MKQKLTLFTDGAEFGGLVIDRKGRQIVFQWFAKTEVENIIWASILVFRLGWPPIRLIRAFISNEQE